MMYVSRFDDLRRAKALRDKADISVRDVAKATGISMTTIQRIRGSEVGNVTLHTMTALCRYFGASSICDLIDIKE